MTFMGQGCQTLRSISDTVDRTWANETHIEQLHMAIQFICF